MAHCCPDLQQEWTNRLASIDININSTDVREDVKSEAELGERLKTAGGEG